MPNRKWTDELIESELRRIARHYDRMPSPSELTKRGLKKLVSAVYARGGFDHWCDLPHDPAAEIVRTPTRSVRVPRVIQLVRYDRLPLRDVRFSRRNVFYRDRNRCHE